MSAADGETRRAEDWVGVGGRARKLANAEVSKERQKIGAVVCVHAKGMKDAGIWRRATERRRRAPSSTFILGVGA